MGEVTGQVMGENTTRRSFLRGSLALGTTAAAVPAALAACALGGQAPSPGAGTLGAAKLTYTNWFAAGSAQDILYQHQTELFTEKHPQITIEEVKRAPGSTMMEQFVSMAAAGTTPDLAALNPQFVEPLRARNMLADLSVFVVRDAKTFKPDDFYAATKLRAIRNGKWYAIPLQMGLWMLLYNRTLLQQAGVPDPDKSWTWDRALEVARTVKEHAPTVAGIAFPPYELPVRDNGGDILSKDERHCVLGEPAAIQAIQWIADLRLKQQVVPLPGEIAGQSAQQLFTSGRYVYHVGDPGFLSNTQHAKPAFDWNIAVPPKGRVAQVSTVKGPSLVIAADSQQKDAAWAWLADYTGVEMQRYVAVEGQIVSARKTALEAYVAVDEGFNKKVLLDIAAMARPMPYIAKYDEMDQIIRTGLDSVNNGQQAASAAMPEVARQVDLLLTSN